LFFRIANADIHGFRIENSEERGAVMGDHCSPISDTTIMSSMASRCNHIQHVSTQMPYALTVGAVALLIGVLPAAMGLPSLVAFLLAFAVLGLVVRFVGKKH